MATLARSLDRVKTGVVMSACFVFGIKVPLYSVTCTSANAQVTEYNGTFIPNTKQADITTPVFTLSKDLANVAITFSAPVKNSWFWAAGEMVNNETGVSYPIEQT